MKRIKTSINVHDSSGSEENDCLDSVDRISALPDPVLGVIVSFLPTKDAVATSVLSKRWKFVWLMTDNLDFYNECYGKEQDEDGNMKFVEFVNRVLLLHDTALLNKFTLLWKPHGILSHASSWITTAIARNVCELIVCVEHRFVQSIRDPQLYEMPESVFRCDSLRSLELNSDVYFSDANVVCLPRLESLTLVSVVFESAEAFERLISGCPLLNYLDIYMDADYMTLFSRYFYFAFIISSTSLRRLKFVCCDYIQDLVEGSFCCSLDLEASSLEFLCIEGFRTEIFVRKSLSSLVEANINIHLHENDFSRADVCDLVVQAVRALECAKVITLSGDVMWALSSATISLSTEFKRLVKLKTNSYCCYCSSLREFIQNSDKLESITVYQEPNWTGKTYLHDHSKFIAPIEVPRCFLNNLKEVVLNGYSGFEDEREMIRYILKYGSALKVMKIRVYRSMDDSTKFELLQDICKLSRKSLACEVEFDDDLSSPIGRNPNSSSSESSSNSNTRIDATSEDVSIA